MAHIRMDLIVTVRLNTDSDYLTLRDIVGRKQEKMKEFYKHKIRNILSLKE